ncbi:extracellular solute-binding protein [Bradyrhizobium sp. 141]|nr:extracellular solute-binding protein [Bradyrhizobium sp. 141]
MSNKARGVMEAALLADGMAPKDMYPFNLARAFKALDRIKPGVASWAAASPQFIILLQTGESDFRQHLIASRRQRRRAAASLSPLSFDQTKIFSSDLAVIKGAPNKENAMKLIAYFFRPEVQVRLESQAGLIPASKKAAAMLPAESRKWQPDLSSPDHLINDSAYWADNFEAVTNRFKEWIQS